MADDLIRKSDVLETYADLYDIFDDNKIIQEELHKVFDKINNIPAVESSNSEKPNNSTISKMEQVEKPQTDWIKREDAIKAVDMCVQDGWYRISPSQAKQNIRDLISEKDEPTEITYQNCSDALLKMWMDNVLTDAEYNRIMDKLNKANRKNEPQPITDCKQLEGSE